MNKCRRERVPLGWPTFCEVMITSKIPIRQCGNSPMVRIKETGLYVCFKHYALAKELPEEITSSHDSDAEIKRLSRREMPSKSRVMEGCDGTTSNDR